MAAYINCIVKYRNVIAINKSLIKQYRTTSSLFRAVKNQPTVFSAFYQASVYKVVEEKCTNT